jgi:hypothetical protein
MNRIVEITVQEHTLTPAMAELWVTVLPERADGGTDVRGRLMGPRCAYATTVEVAYPLRPLATLATPGAPLTQRVVIPEPSLWEPQTPFLYEGPVELWQDGARCDQGTIRHGLRTLTLGARGLRLNGRLLQLTGRERECSPEDVAELRQEGVNLVVAEGDEGLYEAADPVGLFVLARRSTLPGPAEVRHMTAHPSCLGWLFTLETALEGPLPGAGLIGIELAKPPARPLPPGVHFIVANEEHAGDDLSLGAPLLLRGAARERKGAVVLGRLTQLS